MGRYVLGLDLGPNSIGWAMLSVDENTGEANGFADTSSANHPPVGVRIFEAGLSNFGSAKEESLCQQRRFARSARKNHARRNARRRELRVLLDNAGMLPGDMGTDPYYLRTKALDEMLTPEELGRVFYHLSQRRGFQSNRKTGQAKEDKGVLAEIGELAAVMEKEGARTLGEYLYNLSGQGTDLNKPRLRKRHTRRDMYKQEFQAIVDSQRRFHAALLGEKLVEDIRKLIYFQHSYEVTAERRAKAPSRANLHRSPSVKPCPLVEGETCCPKMEWAAQQFRILKEVNNLRISENYGQERELSAGERDRVLDFMATRDTVKFDQLRKELAKLGTDPAARFNLERGDRKSLKGNLVDHRLAASFGKSTWGKMSQGERNDLRDALLHNEDPDDLSACLQRYGLPADKMEKLLTWNPGDGYVAYSLHAIEALLPFLERGENEYVAIQHAFPDREDAHAVDRLPVLSSRDLAVELQNITNPVVTRCLVEVRKVVNAIVREHGVPDHIVVELARDLKAGGEKRKKMTKENRRREEMRKTARIEVERLGGNPHYRSDVNRWLFWKEQGGCCLYTGKPIPQNELFRGGEWEVDHILPHWQSLDDSLVNKALVHRSANGDKGDRTPAQWLGVESQEYKQIIKRAYGLLKKDGGLPYPKLMRLQQLEVKADAFAARQLNDTRYISTMVTKYLNLLYPPEKRVGEKCVQSCKGGLTAELRRHWGMNDLLVGLTLADGTDVPSGRVRDDGTPIKSRADHRHHAVDAIVIALSSRKVIKRYQDFHRNERKPGARTQFMTPWVHLRSDAQAVLSDVNVSHRVVRKIAGAFHEETFYGAAKNREGETLPNVFVTRKNLGELTGKMVMNIRDDVVRGVVSDRLKEKGWDGVSNTLPKDWEKEPLRLASGLVVRRVRIEKVIMGAIRLGERYAVLGNNHHLEVVEYIDKKGEKRLQGAVVPTMEVARRVRPRRGEPKLEPVCRDHGEGKRFVMSLARKESVLATSRVTGEQVLCVVQTMSGSSELGIKIDLRIRDVRDSRVAGEGNRKPFIRLKSFRAIQEMEVKKVQVDPLGRVHPAND